VDLDDLDDALRRDRRAAHRRGTARWVRALALLAGLAVALAATVTIVLALAGDDDDDEDDPDDDGRGGPAVVLVLPDVA